MKNRVLFLGTPEFARFHLASLLQDNQYEIVGVVSQPDRPAGRRMQLRPSPVKALALENGLPVFTPEKVGAPEVVQQLADLRPDVVVVVAFGQILPRSFLKCFPDRVVNVHGSLLPRWRGAAPIQRALMEGDAETGVSLQVMVYELDAGDVIGEYRLPIDDQMDALKLHDLLMPLGARLLGEDLKKYLADESHPQPQDPASVTYAKKIEKAEAEVDWRLSARQVFNRARGLVMGPGSRSRVKGLELKLHDIALAEEAGVQGQPGQVLDAGPEGLRIACGQGSVRVLQVQPQSRARMSVAEFLRGHDLKKGDVFGNQHG